MTNFDFFIDGPIVLIYICIIFYIGIWLRKYVSNVEHFLVANRGVDVYLGIASLAATEFGIATCMANADSGANRILYRTIEKYGSDNHT